LSKETADSVEDLEALRAALRGRGRVTGLLTLWWTAAVIAARVAREAGRVPGEDLEIVAWCPREQLDEFRAAYPEERLPATVVWSIGDLGDAALSRLAERRERPDAPVVRVSVSAELMPAE
jgi:hypothetical protein